MFREGPGRGPQSSGSFSHPAAVRSCAVLLLQCLPQHYRDFRTQFEKLNFSRYWVRNLMDRSQSPWAGNQPWDWPGQMFAPSCPVLFSRALASCSPHSLPTFSRCFQVISRQGSQRLLLLSCGSFPHRHNRDVHSPPRDKPLAFLADLQKLFKRGGLLSFHERSLFTSVMGPKEPWAGLVLQVRESCLQVFGEGGAVLDWRSGGGVCPLIWAL